jgi:hypothetical protein
MTIEEWRELLQKTNSQYAPIDMLADWERDVAVYTDVIAGLRTQVKSLESINHEYEGEVLRLEHNVAVLRGDKKGELL